MQRNQPDLSQQKRAGKSARHYIQAQLITTVVLSAFLLIFDITIAYSSLAGGMIAAVANAWFAVKVFRSKPDVSPQTLLTVFYVGEIYRFLLTGAMFIIVFVSIKPLNIVALLLSYLLVHLTPAVVSMLGRNAADEDNVGYIIDKES